MWLTIIKNCHFFEGMGCTPSADQRVRLNPGEVVCVWLLLKGGLISIFMISTISYFLTIPTFFPESIRQFFFRHIFNFFANFKLKMPWVPTGHSTDAQKAKKAGGEHKWFPCTCLNFLFEFCWEMIKALKMFAFGPDFSWNQIICQIFVIFDFLSQKNSSSLESHVPEWSRWNFSQPRPAKEGRSFSFGKQLIECLLKYLHAFHGES